MANTAKKYKTKIKAKSNIYKLFKIFFKKMRFKTRN